jgi:hypothetical protein
MPDGPDTRSSSRGEGPRRFVVHEGARDLTLVHHVTGDGTLFASRGRRVFVVREGSRREFSRFPVCLPRDLFSFSRLTSRMARADKCNVYLTRGGRVLGIRGGTVYELLEGARDRELFRIQGDCVLHRGICEDESGFVYFGEYFLNPDRRPVRVWRIPPGLGGADVAHEFPAGSIRHVHAVQRDPFDPAALWLTVGDLTGECFFFRSRDGLRTLERFGDGTQTWRAVSLLFTATHVCWLTDSEVETNHACRMERATGRLELGQTVACSTWYSATTTDGVHMAFTTVETGPAITRQESSVLVSRDAFHWSEAHAFRKDRLRPTWLFKAGIIICPSGPFTSRDFWLSGEALVGLDGRSIRAGLDDPEVRV